MQSLLVLFQRIDTLLMATDWGWMILEWTIDMMLRGATYSTLRYHVIVSFKDTSLFYHILNAEDFWEDCIYMTVLHISHESV